MEGQSQEVAQAQSSASQEVSAQDYLLIAHPEYTNYTVSVRNKTQFTINASVCAIPQSPQVMSIYPLDPPQRQPLHYEFTFLSRHALHVRFSFATDVQAQEPFPDDPTFPPPSARDWLSTGYFPTPQDKDDDIRHLGEKVMNCGVELRRSDFNTWVNPRMRGGMEYQFVEDKNGMMGFEGFYTYPEKIDVGDVAGSLDSKRISTEMVEEERAKRAPLWKLCTNGPFSHASLPSGVSLMEQNRRCYELFELMTGENLHVSFTKNEVDGSELLFFWTDRDWGCLVKRPLPASVDTLQRYMSRQLILSVSTEGDRMEYIIVAGEAFERMKSQYGNMREKDE